MTWRTLLQAEEFTAPWLGGDRVFHGHRRFAINPSAAPTEYGWYRWRATGRFHALVVGPTTPDTSLDRQRRGYWGGDIFACDTPHGAVETGTVWLMPGGLPLFSAINIAQTGAGWVFVSEALPQGPEDALRAAFEEGRPVTDVPGVTPAMHLVALTLRRAVEEAEQRRAAVEAAKRAEEQRTSLETGAGRRFMAVTDYPRAAAAALLVGGAEMLACLPTGPGQWTIRFRTAGRRFECVADDTLHILDAGVCLDGDDNLCTLETLPIVIREAIDKRLLHVYRHV